MHKLFTFYFIVITLHFYKAEHYGVLPFLPLKPSLTYKNSIAFPWPACFLTYYWHINGEIWRPNLLPQNLLKKASYNLRSGTDGLARGGGLLKKHRVNKEKYCFEFNPNTSHSLVPWLSWSRCVLQPDALTCSGSHTGFYPPKPVQFSAR